MRSQLTLLKVILLEVTLLNSILSHDTPLPDRVTDNGVYFGDNIGVNIGDNIGVNIGDNIG